MQAQGRGLVTKIDARMAKRLIAVVLACYAGAFVGLGTFHVVSAHRLDLDHLTPLGIIGLVLAPIGYIGMASATPGPNILLLAAIVFAFLFRKFRWPYALLLPAACFAIAAYWTGMMWKTG